MARPPLKLDVDDVVRRYANGETVLSIAGTLGVSHTTIQKRLRDAGVLRRVAEDLRAHKKRTAHALPLDEIARRYGEGESIKSIAHSFGVARVVINRRLDQLGVEHRSISDSMRAKYDAMTAEERRTLVATPERLEACAKTRQRTLSAVGTGEAWLAAELASAGMSVVPQAAVGKYNVDVLVNDSVAVELMADSPFPYTSERDRKRIEYLLQRCAVVVVWSAGRFVLTPTSMRDVVAFCERVCADPAFSQGKYWVIRGSGELAFASHNADNDTVVVSSVRSKYATG